VIIRQTVKRKNIKVFHVPESFGEDVEIIVMPIDKTRKENQYDSGQLMKIQEQSGFARTVLANGQEDVWDEL